RTGILHWTEIDRIDQGRLLIEFRQSVGDLARFDGVWSVHPAAGGTQVVFEAEADLGMPTLAPLLNPVAERTLRETIREILTGLLGPDLSFDGDGQDPDRPAALLVAEAV